ncbi:MOSC domain-containing protein [Labilibaculum euxinus]|uniref:MOSC domain-containing protein n=1 Tax=Labilibaculum euxinus TaxID=2686357 RepID=A0A7M4D909_9BACT|nr:MOSC domain-containing protein [Labilibaculum euxinus]MUP39138.1 MOSC domain-containing protein [Labilibaculum euxinus]MVB08343.1 MOSC domain-containing protein [Labilibaculum euxinus]
MKVVSTNIGKSVEINYHGQIEKTGIYKYAVDQAIFLGKEDVVKDAVIDRRYHGGADKACYWYSEKHYAFWKDKFPNLDWNYGMFGENLTISDLDEGDIKIGDVFQIGNARVQVTQPRQPCYKLNYRFDCNSMVRRFIDAGFPGIYIRVIEEGEVRKGDELILLERREESLSIREVYNLLYESSKDQLKLEKALSDPALAVSCKRDLNK